MNLMMIIMVHRRGRVIMQTHVAAKYRAIGFVWIVVGTTSYERVTLIDCQTSLDLIARSKKFIFFFSYKFNAT